MRPNRTIPLLFIGLIALLLLASGAPGDKAVSDAEKKEAVYRLYAGYKKDFPAVRDIAPQQAMALLNQGKVVFVDTRKPAEMAVAMLPAAVSRLDFLDHRDRYRDKTVVVYCTISYRSGVFAREMAGQGITLVNLQGGILAWILEGGRVYDMDGQATRRVHVYADRWDYAPAGYESVKFNLWEQMF